MVEEVLAYVLTQSRASIYYFETKVIKLYQTHNLPFDLLGKKFLWKENK
jgi:hypothetical protein